MKNDKTKLQNSYQNIWNNLEVRLIQKKWRVNLITRICKPTTTNLNNDNFLKKKKY